MSGARPMVSEIRGVLVAGMHSGGTSAIAAALIGLGLGGPVDPPEPSDQHPHGICESPRIWRFNQRVLAELGTSSEVGMADVAPLPLGWPDDPRISSSYDEAAALLADAFPDEPWVVKDPRLCVVLPFWRRVVADTAAAVLVVRNPIDTARSYEDWLQPEESDRLAWWEYYMRTAVRDLTGLPVLVTQYEQALADPTSWCRSAADWLSDLGLSVSVSKIDSAAAFLDGSARKHMADDDCLELLTVSCRQLYGRLQAACGTYRAWDPSTVL